MRIFYLNLLSLFTFIVERGFFVNLLLMIVFLIIKLKYLDYLQVLRKP